MVGERLAEIRKDHNDTQAVLAKKLNVSVTTVRSWEQEKSSPSHDALVALHRCMVSDRDTACCIRWISA